MKNKYKILCVDDENSILRSIRRSFFNDDDISISAVTSGSEALNYLEKNETDMIISDYMMPRMSGYELLSEVKKKYPSIIRIMLSGYVEKEVIIKSLINYTSITFFGKPWDEVILKKRIRELLTLKSSVGSSNLWFSLNSGFPIVKDILSGYIAGCIKKPEEDRKVLEEFIKRDLIIYLKLLHLSNSDYMDSRDVYEISQLIDIPEESYLLYFIDSETVYNNSGVKYLYQYMDLVLKYYQDLYRIIYGDSEPPALPAYISILNIEKLILLSIFPDFFKKEIENIRKADGDFKIGKDLTRIVKLIFKLWHLPEKIYNYFLAYKNFDPNKKNDSPVFRQFKTLTILDHLVNMILLDAPLPDSLKLLSSELKKYEILIESMKKFRKSQL